MRKVSKSPAPGVAPLLWLLIQKQSSGGERSKGQQVSKGLKMVHICFTHTHSTSSTVFQSMDCQPGPCVAERKVIYSKVWPLMPLCNSRQLHFQIDLFGENQQWLCFQSTGKWSPVNVLHKSTAGRMRSTGAHSSVKRGWSSGPRMPPGAPSHLPPPTLCVCFGFVESTAATGREQDVSKTCQNHQLGLQERNSNQRGSECPVREDQRI